MSRRFRAVFLVLMAAGFSISIQAEDQPAKKVVPTSGELFDTIARMDTAIFDAFNAHDLVRLMALFTDDLEFANIDSATERTGKTIVARSSSPWSGERPATRGKLPA